ncbi:protein kinase [Sorangium sp. So ce321]|uniref:serine/threonine-protein kinase n=1 Tax=Sorangium sp. So ce321 TaxID=3133300 RepID=UPI003F60497D
METGLGSGDVIAGRYEIERVAGEGGMGSVYQARDREAEKAVAVKVLRAATPAARERFQREACVLAELHHPAIVRYVTHGLLGSGEPFLVMEWLEGEDLARRLLRGALPVTEAMALTRRIAEALAAAHARGVVHRDIKPSNLFLPGGDVCAVKLLDFGIARRMLETRPLTATGTFMGTPGYIAPEQARGSTALDARADVFALGCVLFECLTGQPAFSGEDVLAIFAKILFDEVPRVSALRPDVPLGLEPLVARMLSKQPEDRPGDGAAVVRELAPLLLRGGAEQREYPHAVGEGSALTAAEQRLVSVLLVSSTPEPWGPDDRTLKEEECVIPLATLRSVAAPYRARVESLVDGSAIVALAGAGDASDQAAHAARLALAVRAVMPDARMVLTTGRGVLSGAMPVGEAIERAARILREDGGERLAPGRSPQPGPRAVRLDDVTAGLLRQRFEIALGPAGPELVSEASAPESARLLLGRPTPCVGRDRELAMLRALLEECIGEPASRAILVTGVAGIGKSRVHHEILGEVRRAAPPVEVWVAHGDPMRAGSPLGMITELLRRAAGLFDGEPLDVQHDKIRARVGRCIPGPDARRVMEFYGELVGAPWPDEDSMQLRAARRDPLLMSDQLRRSWEDFLVAECAARPVMIVLEDLHWGDPASVEFVNTALRLLKEQPLFVMALARPDIHERFPKLWAERGMQEIKLGELSRKACERLARHVLGEAVDPGTVARVVAQATGNAFYLEELLRAVVEREDEALPETILAMIQARLEALPPEARRVMRAGSIFGEAFWDGGVRALLCGAQPAPDVEAWLSTLVDRELLVRRRETRFPGEHELTFRHAMVREAAYQELTDGDRSLGHRLAGEWLERTGERNAAVLAEHFERGREPHRAAALYAHAMEQALEANDLDAVLARGRQAVACGAHGRLLGHIRRFQAEAHRWRSEYTDCARCASEAMQLLPRSEPSWFAAAGDAALAAYSSEDRGQLLALVDEVSRSVDCSGVFTEQHVTLGRMIQPLVVSGLNETARDLFERFGPAIMNARHDPRVAAHWSEAFAWRAMADGDLVRCADFLSASASDFDRIGDTRNKVRVSLGHARRCSELGEYEEAESILREAIALADRMGLHVIATDARRGLGHCLAVKGALDEARALIEDAIAANLARDARLFTSGARLQLALVLLWMGELQAAEREVRDVVSVVDNAQSLRCTALAILALVLLQRGETQRALRAAEEGMRLFEQAGVALGSARVRLAFAEALWESGEHARAREAILEAKRRLLFSASKLSDPVRRRRFLERVPENARTMDLAARWLAPAASPAPHGA